MKEGLSPVRMNSVKESISSFFFGSSGVDNTGVSLLEVVDRSFLFLDKIEIGLGTGAETFIKDRANGSPKSACARSLINAKNCPIFNEFDHLVNTIFIRSFICCGILKFCMKRKTSSKVTVLLVVFLSWMFSYHLKYVFSSFWDMSFNAKDKGIELSLSAIIVSVLLECVGFSMIFFNGELESPAALDVPDFIVSIVSSLWDLAVLRFSLLKTFDSELSECTALLC